jgi:thiamine-phosphate pyrophosphorylase
MAQSQTADVPRNGPRLYLATPAIADARAFTKELVAAIAAVDVAAVLLKLAPASERELINRAKVIAEVVQRTGAAMLVDGHPEIAVRAGADGAHLTGIAAFTEAVETLKPARIAGCGGLKTRHDAMVAGERGADYVMFGEVEASGRRPAFAAIIERIEWWAPLFEIPCVGFAEDLDEVGLLAAAGADFVALGDAVWNDARGPAAALADAAQRLLTPEAAA